MADSTVSNNNNTHTPHPNFLPRFSSFQKKMLTAVGALAVLTIGTAVGTFLVLGPERSFDDRSKAAGVTGGSIITLNAGKRILIPGKDAIPVDVILAANQKQVTAADISLNVDSAYFDFQSLDKGNYFDKSTSPYGPLTTQLLYDQTTNKGKYDATAKIARIAIGVPVDPCYLGPNPNDGTPACKTSPAPTFYPAQPGTSGKVAVLNVKSKAGVTGKTTIAVAPATATAAVGSDTDATYSLGSLSFCLAYDFDANTKTDNADIQQVANRWNSASGSTNYQNLYDFDNNNRIDNADIQQVANKWNTTCQP